MQAVKGYIDSGRFMPTDGTVLPNYAYAVLVIQESYTNKVDERMDEVVSGETQARLKWLGRLRWARQLAKGGPLPDFVIRQSMRKPHSDMLTSEVSG